MNPTHYAPSVRLPRLYAAPVARPLPSPKASDTPVYPDKVKTERLICQLQYALLLDSLTPLAANARTYLRSLLDAAHVHAETWYQHVSTWPIDARAALATYVSNWSGLHPKVQNMMVRMLEKEVADVREMARQLCLLTQMQQQALSDVSDEEYGDIYALQQEATARLQVAGFDLLTPAALADGAFYDVLTKAGDVLRRCQYDHPRRCFTYQNQRGEFGALPLSTITHLKS